LKNPDSLKCRRDGQGDDHQNIFRNVNNTEYNLRCKGSTVFIQLIHKFYKDSDKATRSNKGRERGINYTVYRQEVTTASKFTLYREIKQNMSFSLYISASFNHHSTRFHYQKRNATM